MPDYAERRLRSAPHLEYAEEAVWRGELILAVVFADPIDGTVRP